MSGPLNLNHSPVDPRRRRQPRFIRPETRQIIRALEKVRASSGDRPEVVFGDWLTWLEVLLTLLPAHLRTAARTGQSHTAQAQELRSHLRERYRRGGGYADPSARIWDSFVEVLGFLLAVVRSGLWADSPEAGPMGPDILGEVYMAYSDYDPAWQAYQLVSWQEHRLTANQTLGLAGETEILDRLREACQHPGNAAGLAALQEAPSADQPQAVADWLTGRVIPAAMATYEPFTILDAWAGTGARLLALAPEFPGLGCPPGLGDLYHFRAGTAVRPHLPDHHALRPERLLAPVCALSAGFNPSPPSTCWPWPCSTSTGVPPLPAEAEGRDTLKRRFDAGMEEALR
ncbi:MAG: hypothetical protein U0401_20285 [Anaerolineae bacterium]